MNRVSPSTLMLVTIVGVFFWSSDMVQLFLYRKTPMVQLISLMVKIVRRKMLERRSLPLNNLETAFTK